MPLGQSQLSLLDNGTIADLDGIKLSPLASQLLQILARRPGSLVERTELIDRLWRGNWLIGDPALNRVISEIRSALGDDPKQPTLIQTVPRRGYRLILPAENSRLGIVSPGNASLGLLLFRRIMITILVLTICLATLGLVATAARYFR